MYESEVLEVYKFSDTTSLPVDCKKIADSIGYKIKTYQSAALSSEHLSRMMRVSKDAYVERIRKSIYYNENISNNCRIRFSLAHELGHVIMLTDSEDVADIFASNLLAPRPIVFALQLRTAVQIAEVFNISITSANKVIMDMHRHGFYNPGKVGNEMIDYFGLRGSCPSLDNVWNRIRMVR